MWPCAVSGLGIEIDRLGWIMFLASCFPFIVFLPNCIQNWHFINPYLPFTCYFAVYAGWICGSIWFFTGWKSASVLEPVWIFCSENGHFVLLPSHICESWSLHISLLILCSVLPSQDCIPGFDQTPAKNGLEPDPPKRLPQNFGIIFKIASGKSKV